MIREGAMVTDLPDVTALRRELASWELIGEPIVPVPMRAEFSGWDSKPLLALLSCLRLMVEAIEAALQSGSSDAAGLANLRDLRAAAGRLEMIWKMRFIFADRLHELDWALLREPFGR